MGTESSCRRGFRGRRAPCRAGATPQADKPGARSQGRRIGAEPRVSRALLPFIRKQSSGNIVTRYRRGWGGMHQGAALQETGCEKDWCRAGPWSVPRSGISVRGVACTKVQPYSATLARLWRVARRARNLLVAPCPRRWACAWPAASAAGGGLRPVVVDSDVGLFGVQQQLGALQGFLRGEVGVLFGGKDVLRPQLFQQAAVLQHV